MYRPEAVPDPGDPILTQVLGRRSRGLAPLRIFWPDQVPGFPPTKISPIQRPRGRVNSQDHEEVKNNAWAEGMSPIIRLTLN